MHKLLCAVALWMLAVLAHATVTGTASTATFACTNSPGPFPFTFPVDDVGALLVIDIPAGSLPGVMTVLASNQWAGTPVNNSYANGGSIALLSPCPSGDTLVIARATEPTQLTHFTPYMPALYADFENGLDQLTTGRQDTFRVDQLHIGNIVGNGAAAVNYTPLGQYLNLTFPDQTGTASVNRIISVLESPYNASCDGVTNDQAAIQAAFNDAMPPAQGGLYVNGASIQFPAGICKTGTITWMGQNFFGAGVTQTTILGEPGQDVFATPDSAATLLFGAYVHDMTIESDGTVNAAATAVSGNNTFPNRIYGTAGGTTALPASSGGPPAPGGMAFGPAVTGTCDGSMTNGSPILTVPCAEFLNGVPSSFLVGQIATVVGAGTSGGTLTTTVASVTDNSHIVLAANASTTTSTASGTIAGTSMDAPWYCGNAGIAIPASSGAAMASNFNGYVFRNLQFTANGSPKANYVCGLFMQAASNNISFEHVAAQGLWGGLIEAPPASNNTSYFAWTPDTNFYDDINLKFNAIPMTMYNGSHRTGKGINIYSGEQPFALGLFQFEVALGSGAGAVPSMTVNRYYDECFSLNAGEHSRFSGNGNVIQGGALGQCGGTNYANWLASESTVNATINNLVISAPGTSFGMGAQNVFTHTGLGAANLTDNGLDNSVDTSGSANNSNLIRRVYLDRPVEPVGKLDAGFLLSGNPTAPFAGSSDLLMSCKDFNFAFSNGSFTTPGCTLDPGDVYNPIQTYFHSDSTNYASGFGFGPSFQGTGPLNKLLIVGDRIPQSGITIAIGGRCNAACLTGVTVADITAGGSTIGSSTLRFTTNFSAQTLFIDLSGTTLGDWITINIVPAWGGGVTTEDVAFIGIAPNAPSPATLSPCTYTFYNSPPSAVVPPAGCYYDTSFTPTNFSIDLPNPGSATYFLLGPGFQWRVNSGNPVSPRYLASVPTTWALTVKSSASATPTFYINCDGGAITGSTTTPTVGTTFTTVYITANLAACTSFGNLSLGASGFTSTLTYKNVVVTPETLPQPQPTAAGQVPVSTLINGQYYYMPTSFPFVADTTVAVAGGTMVANTCSSGTNVAMAGLTTAMKVGGGYSTDPTSLTGWGATAGMTFSIWPSSANMATWKVCNITTLPITHSAITFNVSAQ